MKDQLYEVKEIIPQILFYLSGGELAQFESWVAKNFDAVLQFGTDEDKELMNFVQGSFIEIGEGITTLQEFHQELLDKVCLLHSENHPLTVSSLTNMIGKMSAEQEVITSSAAVSVMYSSTVPASVQNLSFSYSE